MCLCVAERGECLKRPLCIGVIDRGNGKRDQHLICVKARVMVAEIFRFQPLDGLKYLGRDNVGFVCDLGDRLKRIEKRGAGRTEEIGRLTRYYSAVVKLNSNCGRACFFSLFKRGMLVDYVKEIDASLIVRGLRAVTDFEYELQITQTNHILNPEVETIFLTTNLQYSYLSSTIVKEIASYGGDISQFVPPEFIERIYEKLRVK